MIGFKSGDEVIGDVIVEEISTLIPHDVPCSGFLWCKGQLYLVVNRPQTSRLVTKAVDKSMVTDFLYFEWMTEEIDVWLKTSELSLQKIENRLTLEPYFPKLEINLTEMTYLLTNISGYSSLLWGILNFAPVCVIINDREKWQTLRPILRSMLPIAHKLSDYAAYSPKLELLASDRDILRRKDEVVIFDVKQGKFTYPQKNTLFDTEFTALEESSSSNKHDQTRILLENSILKVFDKLSEIQSGYQLPKEWTILLNKLSVLDHEVLIGDVNKEEGFYNRF